MLANKPARQTIAQKISPTYPNSLRQNKSNELSLEQFQEAFKAMQGKRGSAQNGYEKVIQTLEGVIKDLVGKIDFLNKDRDVLLRENYDLRRRNQSLQSIIEVKDRLRDSMGEPSDIFEILVETASAARMSKIEESIREEDEDEVPQTKSVMEQSNGHIINRQEFIIMSNPLSYNTSQNEQNEISMSNIGRTETVVQANIQTPGLSKENIYIQCNASNADGIIRAFYLSLIQKKETTRAFIKLIDSMRDDSTVVLYEPYPTNDFWTQMLCNFLNLIHEGRFDTQMEVLQYIKFHYLIDSLLIKCLKGRIEFIFDSRETFESPTVEEVLRALSNEFNLRIQIQQGQFVFYSKQARDQNLLMSDRASLQISLNNKSSQNKYFIRDEEALFTMYERQDCLQMPFFIVIDNDLGLSQYQIQQQSEQNNHSFGYSDNPHHDSIEQKMNCIQIGGKDSDHLDGIRRILNQKEMNLWQGQGPQLSRKPCHRRYQHFSNQLPYQYQEPTSSSRFFLDRVDSSKSSLSKNNS